MPAASALPLAGIRIIELSSFVAAPLAGMTLRQLGAEVYRVDPPGGGPDIDRWPVTDNGVSLYWAGLNKGKRSLEVEVRTPEGRAIVRDLVAHSAPRSTVVLTNAVGRPWLSRESLQEVCADVIVVEIAGERDGSPAVDYTVNAAMGFPLVTGPAESTSPVNHVLPAWDIACGLFAAVGAIAAVHRRELTGQGETVRIALADVALSLAGSLGFLAEAQINSFDRPRIGNHLYGTFANDFACADGRRLMVVTLTPRHWRDLVEITGIDAAVIALESGLGVSFEDESTRFHHREVLAALMRPWFESVDFANAAARLRSSAVLWAPYRTFFEVIRDLEANPSPLVSTVNQPGVGAYLSPAGPIAGAWATSAEPSPRLGQDTERILHEVLGLDQKRIQELAASGIIAGVAE
jgi:2-methylfumaryl-CoA isomerase